MLACSFMRVDAEVMETLTAIRLVQKEHMLFGNPKGALPSITFLACMSHYVSQRAEQGLAGWACRDELVSLR